MVITRQRGPVGLLTDCYVDPIYGSDANRGTFRGRWATLDHGIGVAAERMEAGFGDTTITVLSDMRAVSTILLDDTNTNINGKRLTIKFVDGARLLGTQRVTGWTLVDAPNNVWSAPATLPFLRSLWVNGIRCFRPKRLGGLVGGASRNSTGYLAAGDPILSDPNPGDIVMHYNVPDLNFQVPQNVVASIAGNQINMLSVPHTYITGTGGYSREGWPNYGNTVPLPLDIEGCLLDFEDQLIAASFYHNRASNEILLIPPVGVDMTTAIVEAPLLERVLNCQGAKHLDIIEPIFEGDSYASFRTQGYTEVSSGLIYDATHDPGGDAYGGVTTATMAPATVTLDDCEDVRLIEPMIRRTEGIGLHIGSGNLDIEVYGELIDDTGGNTVMIGRPEAIGEATVPDGINLHDHIWTRAGRLFKGSVHCRVVQCTRSSITDFLAYDAPYASIIHGFGVGNHFLNDLVELNIVARFEMHGVMTYCGDGAAMYTLNHQHGMTIEDFYIHDVDVTRVGGPPCGAMYLDEAANAVTVRRGVIDNSRDTLVFNNLEATNACSVTEIYADRSAVFMGGGDTPDTYNVPTVSGDPTTGPGATIIATTGPAQQYLDKYSGDLP